MATLSKAHMLKARAGNHARWGSWVGEGRDFIVKIKDKGKKKTLFRVDRRIHDIQNQNVKG
jgi:hypothetical protein